MNEITTFVNEKFGQLRTVTINNEVWFVGKDVTDILGYKNASKAIFDHVDSEDKLNNESLSSLGQRGGWLINESGLYSLVLSSKLPTAKEFKRWVTSEILPSIRKHGAYMTPETIEKVLLNPDTIIKIALQLKAAQEKVAELQPKADYYDAVANSDGELNMRETAKLLGIKERVFVQYLLINKFCYRNSKGSIIPYARYNDSFFRLYEVTYGSLEDPHVAYQTKVTNYGRTKLFERLKREGLIEGKNEKASIEQE